MVAGGALLAFVPSTEVAKVPLQAPDCGRGTVALPVPLGTARREGTAEDSNHELCSVLARPMTCSPMACPQYSMCNMATLSLEVLRAPPPASHLTAG